MTPTEKLVAHLNAMGITVVGDIDRPRGGQTREDCMRWSARVRLPGYTGIPPLVLGSFDTITACAKRGLQAEITTPSKSMSGYHEVHANERK